MVLNCTTHTTIAQVRYSAPSYFPYPLTLGVASATPIVAGRLHDQAPGRGPAGPSLSVSNGGPQGDGRIRRLNRRVI